MRVLFILFVISIAYSNSYGQAPIINIYNINDTRQNKMETFTNTEKISGQPYFLNEWNKGTIVLDNGNIYDSYLIKYNTNNQTVLILQGTETIEIEQKIKEFILNINTYRKPHFINANIYNTKQIGYLEIVDDNKDCKLLRLNKKVGESNSEKLTNITESKTFQNTIEYFIFNKTSNKLTTYKKADPTLKKLYELNLL